MRLEGLCTLRMRYGEGTWLAPYGENEYTGFGTGKGDVVGPKIRGTMHWANLPRRREDASGVRTSTGRLPPPTARRSSSPSKDTASSRRLRPSTARSSPRYGSKQTTPDTGG